MMQKKSNGNTHRHGSSLGDFQKEIHHTALKFSWLSVDSVSFKRQISPAQHSSTTKRVKNILANIFPAIFGATARADYWTLTAILESN